MSYRKRYERVRDKVDFIIQRQWHVKAKILVYVPFFLGKSGGSEKLAINWLYLIKKNV